MNENLVAVPVSELIQEVERRGWIVAGKYDIMDRVGDMMKRNDPDGD